jgi:putative transposase
MRSHSELYVHLVWTTWERTPWLTAPVRGDVFSSIRSQALKVDAEVLAIGGVEDHVHVLARFPARVSIAELVGQLKGASSHFANKVLHLGAPFRWQGTYGAFSVSRRGLPTVSAYVMNQEQHHRARTLLPVLERTEAA